MADDWALTFYLDDLRTEYDRANMIDRIQDFAGAGVRAEEFFEIVLRSRTGDMIYGVEVAPPAAGAPWGEDVHISEDYFPNDGRSNTWMYADVKPGRAPVSRQYDIDEEIHPGRTAGFLGSRATQLFEALQERFPHMLQPAEDHER